MAWVFLAAFSQINSENWEQKGEQKDLENMQFVKKRSTKLGPRKNVTIEETGYIEKKPVLCIDVGQ